MALIPDFNQFGEELWEIANVFRDDALHATERLETFSLFLFLKLWDEIEIEREEATGKKIPDNEQLIPEKYRFHNWASDPDGYAKEHDFDDTISFCKQMFIDLASRQSKHPTARDVQRLFKDTVFRLRYTSTVRALASRLLELNLREIMSRGLGEGERYDIFGRAYEYLLQQFGQSKEFAEYFTPRHVVDRMVQIIDPEIGETIYDPACGTGGFIVRAFERVMDKIKRKRISAVEQEGMLRQLKEKHLFGVEHVPLVFKLALMNMILHRDGSSQLQSDDSLSNKAQDVHKGKYDCVLANPPFGPTKQERLAQFEYHIKLYEALFIQHMMNSLWPGGRAAVVLKEGLLFDSKKMLRKICHKLVEQFEVLGVISLPNGVFNPYSGAKTSIVVFRKPLGKDDVRTSKVWFYRVESDGRDLGATRRSLPDFATDGDLDHMVSLWPYTWRHEKDGGVRAILKSDKLKDFVSKKSWWASIDDLRKTDYNLTAGRYCPHKEEAVEHEKPEVLINRLMDLEDEIKTDLKELLSLVSDVELTLEEKEIATKKIYKGWTKISLGQLMVLEYGKSFPEKDRRPGPYAVYGSNGIVGRAHRYLLEESTVIVGRKGSAGEINLSEPKSWPIDTTYFVRLKGRKLHSLDYAYYLLKWLDPRRFIDTTTKPGLNRDRVYEQIVPLPPLPVQERIVQILQKVDEIRNKRQEASSLIDSNLPAGIHIFDSLISRAFSGELTAEWEIANAEEIAKRTAFHDRLPQLLVLALLAEKIKHAKENAVEVFVTALMKYAFLFQMEGTGRRHLYRFVPYHYGPFAKELYTDLERLKEEGLVDVETDSEEEKVKITLKDKAKVGQALKELPDDIKEDVTAIIDTYGDLNHNSLLKLVYEKYPAYAKKSRLRKGRTKKR